ncbi:MAG: YqhA family protein [Hyphomicrobium sp.]
MLRFAMSLRFIMLVASLGTAFGSVVMFWEGSTHMLYAAQAVASGSDAKLAIAEVMGGTDAFLFGVVLIIFAYNIAFGFVVALPKVARQTMPKWMRPSSMHELKATLVSVTLVYLVVDFATDWAKSNFTDSWTVLVKPISILLIAAALRLMSAPDTTMQPGFKRVRPASARAPAPAAQNP